MDFIKNWKPPCSIKGVQIFIRFANFYRRFIMEVATICTPILEILKDDKTKFYLGPKQNQAFEELKTQFITPPSLEHFYPDLEKVIEPDASDFVLGWVLSQFKEKRLDPVAFHSRKLNDAERNYEIHDTELLAILKGFKEWKHDVVESDRPNTMYTDHQNLQYLLTTKVWHQRQVRWAQQLADFNFKII